MRFDSPLLIARSLATSLPLLVAELFGAPAAAQTCQTDLGFGGPGDLALTLCGQPLDDASNSATLQVTGAPPFAIVHLIVGLQVNPTPRFGGTVVPVPWAFVESGLAADGAGNLSVNISGNDRPFTQVYLQAVAVEPPGGQVEISNALEIELGKGPLIYADAFELPAGSSWPAPWLVTTPHVTANVIDAGRARLQGDLANVARMILPGYSALDVDVRVTLEYEAFHSQGIGVYARQNGGSLTDTTPHGQGYAMFLEGGGSGEPELGLWREIDGVEIHFAAQLNPLPDGGQDGVRYVARFQVEQVSPSTTALRAKVWIEGDPEPADWGIEALDGAPELQNLSGGFATDIYNYAGTGSVWFDDLEIRHLP